jgi:hypothetical protein
MKAHVFAASFAIAVAACAMEVPVSRSAVLVELFTSEGCSSCPPADALLEALDRSNSGDRPEVIVLSEHVDYWNQIGWTDPYSSPLYSARQRTYANRFGLESVYTPQMVVDGSVQFLGSDRTRAKNAIEREAQTEKATIRVFAIPAGNGQPQRVRVEVDAFLEKRGAAVYLALASNEATSQVLAGENGGRRLHHVAVVRSLTSIGEVRRGIPFAKEVPLGSAGGGSAPLRLVAFVQEHGQERVLGVAMTSSAW